MLNLRLGAQEAATNAAFTMSDSSEPVNKSFQSQCERSFTLIRDAGRQEMIGFFPTCGIELGEP
jgi:hypothetical protein